jgi:hypothetical protein
MKYKFALGVAFGLLVTSSPWARGDVPFPFSFTANGGLLPTVPTDPDGPEGPLQPDGTTGFSLFTLSMEDHVPPIGEILSLELVLNGLTHTSPEDLDIYLFGPRGTTQLEVMTDRGDGLGVANLDVVFSDLASGFPPLLPADGPLGGGPYKPEGQNGFGNFTGLAGGPGAWYLFIIDDSQGDQGALGSWTLRGTAVPEPVTLSLLALGALMFLRRRRA